MFTERLVIKYNILRFIFEELVWVITDFGVDVECEYEMDSAFPKLSVNKPRLLKLQRRNKIFMFVSSLSCPLYMHRCVTSSLNVMLFLLYMAQLSGI